MTTPTDPGQPGDGIELALSTETLDDLDPDDDSGEIKGGGKICSGKATGC